MERKSAEDTDDAPQQRRDPRALPPEQHNALLARHAFGQQTEATFEDFLHPDEIADYADAQKTISNPRFSKGKMLQHAHNVVHAYETLAKERKTPCLTKRKPHISCDEAQ